MIKFLLFFLIGPKCTFSILEQKSSSSVFGVQSSLGNKRKWLSLPLEEVSQDDDDKTPTGGSAHPDAEPTSDSPTSPNHALHNNRAHDSRSKCATADCSRSHPRSLLCLFLLSCLTSVPMIPRHVSSLLVPAAVFFSSLTHGWRKAWHESETDALLPEHVIHVGPQRDNQQFYIGRGNVSGQAVAPDSNRAAVTSPCLLFALIILEMCQELESTSWNLNY